MYSGSHDILISFEDPEILKAIEPWKKIIDEKGSKTVGRTKVPLKKGPCSSRECNLGNFIGDALIFYYISTLTGSNKNPWTDPIIALVPTGSIRTTINAGGKWKIFRNRFFAACVVPFSFE